MSKESNVKQESAIGRSWEEFEKDIYTAEEIRESDCPTDYKEWKKGTTSGFVFPRCSVYATGNFMYV